ncbi:MAG: hypothetical protein ACI8RD_010287, partial [Bacillariaceae sp.]
MGQKKTFFNNFYDRNNNNSEVVFPVSYSYFRRERDLMKRDFFLRSK